MTISVLADDLTGANVVAALLLRQGWTVDVHLGAKDLASFSQSEQTADVHVWNMGTRNAADDVAKHVFSLAASSVHHPVSFRIDSTLRGPIAPSLNALLDARPDGVAMVVPAYPDSFRTTRNGIHYMDDVPIHQTTIAKDPGSPVVSSDLREIIGSKSRYPWNHLTLERLWDAGQAGESQVLEWIQSGCRLILCDAVTNLDILALAKLAITIQRRGHSIISVDPGPFTASFHRLVAGRVGPRPVILGVSASVMHNAKSQMDYLENQAGVMMVHYSGQPVDEVVSQVRRIIASGPKIREGFAHRLGGALFIRTDTWDLPASSSAEAIRMLPDVVRAVIATVPTIRGLYLSGGEAAFAVLSGLGVTDLSMQMEVAPQTAMTRARNGLVRGKLIVTKGGAIGSETAALMAIETLFNALLVSENESNVDLAPL